MLQGLRVGGSADVSEGSEQLVDDGRQPADSVHAHDRDEHLDDLKKRIKMGLLGGDLPVSYWLLLLCYCDACCKS